MKLTVDKVEMPRGAGDFIVGDLLTQNSLSYYTDEDGDELDPIEYAKKWTISERMRASFIGTKTTKKMLQKEIYDTQHELEEFDAQGGVNYFIAILKGLLALTVLFAYSAEPILFYFAKADNEDSYAFSVASVFVVSTFVIAFTTWILDGCKYEFWTHFTKRDLCIFAIVRFLGSLAHIIRPLSLVYLGVGPFVVISSLQVVANAGLHYIVEGHAISTNQGVSIFILLMALVAFQGSDFASGGEEFIYGFFLLCCALVGLGLAHVFGEQYLKEVFSHYEFNDDEKLCVTNTFDLVSYIIIMFIMDWEIIKTGMFTGWTMATWMVTIDYGLIFVCGIMTLMHLSAVIYALIITGAVAFSYLGDIFVIGKPFQLDKLFLMVVIVSLVIAYQVDGAHQYYIEHHLHHVEIEAREQEAERILSQYMNLKKCEKTGKHMPTTRRHINPVGLPTTCIGQKKMTGGGASTKKSIGERTPLLDPHLSSVGSQAANKND